MTDVTPDTSVVVEHARGPASLPARRVMPLLALLESAGICGGATHDALVAETARVAGLTLVSFDVRARSTYGVVGVDVTWLD